jgi:N-acyl homoserine lactone hydrolase
MRLYILQLGLMGGGVPVPGYLIQTDDGTNVLVDTGFVEGLYHDPSPWPDLEASEADWVVNRLAEIGLAPEDVDYLVCTHLDTDHAGSHDAFPNAELVIQRAHHEAAFGGAERYAALRPHWDFPGARYRVVDSDTELLPGVELIESSGHVPGHQAVLVRLPETGPVLLAIDAIPGQLGDTLPEERELGEYDSDLTGLRASTRKLVDLAEREGVTLIVHGHDPNQWRELRKSPEAYA